MALRRITARTKASRIQTLLRWADWSFVSFTLTGLFDYGEMILAPDMNWVPWDKLTFRDIQGLKYSTPPIALEDRVGVVVQFSISFPASEGTGDSPLRVEVGLGGYGEPQVTMIIDCREIEFEEYPRPDSEY